MTYPLFEHLIVASAVASAAALAVKRWWPTKNRAATGCGSGCGGCGSAAGCNAPAETGVPTVAMPASRRTPR